MDAAGRVAFFAKTIPQVFGEEVVTMLPFPALEGTVADQAG